MLIGYMRVSKSDGSQTVDLQRDALLALTESETQKKLMITEIISTIVDLFKAGSAFRGARAEQRDLYRGRRCQSRRAC